MAELPCGSTILSLNFGRQLLHNLALQQQAGRHCDIIVVAEGRKYPAHRCVLAAASNYFCSLLEFNQGRPRLEGAVAQLSEVSSAGLETALEFIYTSVVNTERCSWEELLQAARFLEIKPLEDILMSDLQTSENNNATSNQTDNEAANDNETTNSCKKVALSPSPRDHAQGENGSERNNDTPLDLSPSPSTKHEEKTVESPSTPVSQASSPRRTRRQRKNPRPHKVRSSSDLHSLPDDTPMNDDDKNVQKKSEETTRNKDKDATSAEDVLTDTTSPKVYDAATDNSSNKASPPTNGTGLENIKIENTFSLHGMENSFNLRALTGKCPPKYAEVVPPNVTVGQHIPNGPITRSHASNVNTTTSSTTYPPATTTTVNQLTVKTENSDSCAITSTPQVISPGVVRTNTAIRQVATAPLPYLQPANLNLNTLNNIAVQTGSGVAQCIPQVNQLPGGAIIHLIPNPIGLSPVTPLLQQYPFQLVTAPNSNVLLQVNCTDKAPQGEVHSPTSTSEVKNTDKKTQQNTDQQNVLQALRVNQRPDQEQVGQPHLNIPTLVKLVLVSQADELGEPDILALMKRIKPSIETEYPPSVLRTKVSAALDCGHREGIFTRKRDMNQRQIWAINAAKLKPVVEELRWNVYRHTIYKHSTINN
ncbi:ZBTB7A [Branchiostoma lanceolatum]|uniref:ZBTB7A protein n=1 Tax=Branchiostoma lanceolatum TaxID=7740 RepID=A0A8K0EW79_BRALA|nr:ZBTB7A [Branchiostoma lanceolatum]